MIELFFLELGEYELEFVIFFKIIIMDLNVFCCKLSIRVMEDNLWFIYEYFINGEFVFFLLKVDLGYLSRRNCKVD